MEAGDNHNRTQRCECFDLSEIHMNAGHAAEIIRGADLNSYTKIGFIGGDGTIHEALQVSKISELIQLCPRVCLTEQTGTSMSGFRWFPFRLELEMHSPDPLVRSPRLQLLILES